MSGIAFEDLQAISSASEAEKANIFSRLETQKPAFISNRDTLAILAFGGTIQSAYDPNQENIIPVVMSPALDRMEELKERFGLASQKITGTILVIKDSRQLTNADVIMLLHTIEEIDNRKILVTCGTYLLPTITRVLDHHFGHGKSDKIIGVTGSLLPPSHKAQDVDFNIGGAVAAINAFDFAKQKGIVFAQFHGQIIVGDELAELNLHHSAFKPRFARSYVDTR